VPIHFAADAAFFDIHLLFDAHDAPALLPDTHPDIPTIAKLTRAVKTNFFIFSPVV
jgi:hypothetical protein